MINNLIFHISYNNLLYGHWAQWVVSALKNEIRWQTAQRGRHGQSPGSSAVPLEWSAVIHARYPGNSPPKVARHRP